MMRKTLILPLMIFGLIVFIFTDVQTVRAQSPADCDAFARNEARRYSGSMIGGAARGAARGALFGAIVGNRKSARRGAALGAIGGGARRAMNREREHRRAYDDCMAGRVRW